MAVERAKALIRSVGGRIGTTRRVIITDGGLSKFGGGIVWPPELEGKSV